MCFVGRSIYKHMITENTMITEKQNSSSLLVSWFWEPLELLCEHCASVSWKRASSSDCLPELFGKSITESVPHSSQLRDPDVFVLCCLYANTCMSLKIFVLFRGCGREKILCSFIFSILDASWCFQYDCLQEDVSSSESAVLFLCLHWNWLTVLPSFCSVPVFSLQCFSLEHSGKEEFSSQRKDSVLPLCLELSGVGAWATWPNKTCSEKGMG